MGRDVGQVECAHIHTYLLAYIHTDHHQRVHVVVRKFLNIYIRPCIDNTGHPSPGGSFVCV